MSAADLIDTNVLVYAYDPSDQRKQQIAQGILLRGIDGGCVLSTQVLAEFAAVLLHKKSPPASGSDVKTLLDLLAPIPVVAASSALVRRAVEAREEYGLHFYDGMVVAAAESAGCARILSEDFSTGQVYFGVRVENPFL